jgi:hypothetical protein
LSGGAIVRGYERHRTMPGIAIESSVAMTGGMAPLRSNPNAKNAPMQCPAASMFLSDHYYCHAA